MSARAVLIGLAGGAIICALSYFNDFVLHQTFLVGTTMPVSVYGTLLVALLVNGLVFRVSRRLAFTGREIAVAIALTLVACAVPGSSLMRTFTVSLVLPRHYNKITPGWSASGLVDRYTPPGVLVDVERRLAAGRLASAAGAEVTLDDAAGAVAVSVAQGRLRILDGAAAGQARDLVAFDGATRRARTVAPFDPAPAAGDRYELVEDCEDEVVTAFIQGSIKRTAADGTAGDADRAGPIPWWAWARPLAFWVPLILTLWAALIGLGLFVHERWSRHEHLPYPIAQLADSFLPPEGAPFGGVFKDRRFWVAAGAIFALYMNNYIQRLTGAWIEIPTHFNFWPIMHLTNIQGQARGYYAAPTIYFSVIAIAYFLRSEVSLSVGLGPLVYGWFLGLVGGYGVSFVEGGERGINHQSFMIFGAFIGMVVIIVYEGRHYYAHGMRQALGMGSSERLPAAAVWGARVFLAALALFIGQLAVAGLGLGVATIFAILLMVFFTVMGRIIAETGLFFIQPGFVMSTILIGLVGPRFLGLTPTILLMLFSSVVTIDPRETFMPFFVNSLKIVDQRGAKIGRVGALSGLALVIGLAVAIPATLHWQYTEGANLSDGFATHEAAGFAYRNTLRLKYRQEAQGGTAESIATSGGIASIRPVKPALLWTAVLSFALVIGLSLGKMRFPWWPIHPVIILVCVGWGVNVVGFSFLIGWLGKVLVMKYGGTRVYQDVKPIVIGVVAGEFISALVPIVSALVYYAITGEIAKSFSVFPL